MTLKYTPVDMLYSDDAISAADAPEGFEPIISHSQFSWRSGPMFEGVKDGKWARGFRVSDIHTNMGGFCHGGMLMTFADIILARGIMEVCPPPFVTLRMTSDFVSTAMLGAWVEGHSEVSRVTNSLAFVDGELLADGDCCLSFSGVFKRFQPR